MRKTSKTSKKIVGSSSNNSVIRFKDEKGNNIMNITKVVEKQVTNPVSGQKVTRKANITFTVPDYTVTETKVDDKTKRSVTGLTIQNAISVFGSTEKLIQYAIAGLWNHIRTNESNDLGRADKATRQLSKASKALKSVMPSLTDEALRAMLMSNPEYAKTFENQEFSLEVSKTVDLASLEAPVLVPEGKDEDEADDVEDDDTVAATV